jgi:hypothetical protein
MWGGVTAIDHWLFPNLRVSLALALDIALGAVLYPAAAWLFARPASRTFLETLRRARRPPAKPPGGDETAPPKP